MIDFSVLIIVGIGVVCGILQGIGNIKQTRSGLKPSYIPSKDRSVYIFLDI